MTGEQSFPSNRVGFTFRSTYEVLVGAVLVPVWALNPGEQAN